MDGNNQCCLKSEISFLDFRKQKRLYLAERFGVYMETNFAWRIFNRLKNDRFFLSYMGSCDDELTEILMRNNESSVEESMKMKKRLSFLIAECFQNIIRHADKPEVITQTNNKPQIFILRNIEKRHYICSSNLIANTKKNELESTLEKINVLNQEELRTLYTSAFVNNELSEKGGGGLGLIEMARKSGSPLDFMFDYVNYYHSNFFMQVCISTAEETLKPKAFSIAETQLLYNEMLDQHIVFIRKGDFSQETILPLIDLIEGSLKLQSGFSGSRKKTIYLLIELLQNMSKHALMLNEEREGIFIVVKNKQGYRFVTGNYIRTTDVERLKEKLNAVVGADKDQLTNMYKATLLNRTSNENGNAGIGLIELGKYSSGKISFNFKDMDDTTSFYSLSVDI